MNPLKILTLNTGLMEIDLPILRRISLVKQKDIRVHAVIQELGASDYDLVLLQETGGSLSKKIIRELNSVFPYHATHRALKLFSSHLLILSKLPLENVKFVPFKNQTRLEGFAIQKGFLCADITWENTVYHVINTHLVATVAGINDKTNSVSIVRAKQIKQIQEYVRSEYADEALVIVSGDFNCGPTYCNESYNVIVDELYDCMNHALESDRITWSTKNPNIQNISKNDPDKQTDGFYIKHHQYQHLKNRMNITRAFVDEIEITYNNKTKRVVLSDHYGVEMKINN